MTFKDPWDDFDAKNSDQSGGNLNDKNNKKSEKKFTNPIDFNSDYFSKIESFLLKQFNSKSIIVKILLILLILWLLTGFYIVKQEEKAIILRFGKYVRDADPGLHYKAPYPIELAIKEAVTRVRIIKVGDINPYKSHEQNPADSLMLTGDENMVYLTFEVQWKINNLRNFVFNVKDRYNTIQDASKSAIREIISRNKLQTILTSGRSSIELESKKLLQEIVDSYNMGVDITLVQMLKADPPLQVIDSFRDVQTARVDKESEINNAYKYENEIIPNARGEAGKIFEDAESYAISTVNKAKGDASRFNQIYQQYRSAPYITRKRIYLETMQEIFQNNKNITIIDDSVKNVILNNSNSDKNIIINNDK